MGQYDTIASDDVINKTEQALTANGFRVTVAANGTTAKEAVLAAIPKGAEVFTATSQTLEKLGLNEIFNQSGDYNAIMPKLVALMGDPTKKQEQRKMGAAPDYVVGSVHALTQDGHALIASQTGSQLPAYAYGAGQVIWVVGAQKIVKDMNQAYERLEQYVFPLEDARAKVAYGSGSSINKVLVYNKEANNRVHIIIIKEAWGF
jgi:L-lactate utilization protein LutC